MKKVFLAAFAILLPLAACDSDRGSLAINQAGIIPVGFALSPEIFQKWRVAQTNLDNEPAYAALEIPAERIDLRRPSDESIDRVSDRLAGNPQVKSAIERSGLSVKDYVLATIAMNQAMLADASTETSPTFLRNRDIATANRDEIRRSRNSSRFAFDEGGRSGDSDSDGDSDRNRDSDKNADSDNKDRGDRKDRDSDKKGDRDSR